MPKNNSIIRDLEVINTLTGKVLEDEELSFLEIDVLKDSLKSLYCDVRELEFSKLEETVSAKRPTPVVVNLYDDLSTSTREEPSSECEPEPVNIPELDPEDMPDFETVPESHPEPEPEMIPESGGESAPEMEPAPIVEPTEEQKSEQSSESETEHKSQHRVPVDIFSTLGTPLFFNNEDEVPDTNVAPEELTSSDMESSPQIDEDDSLIFDEEDIVDRKPTDEKETESDDSEPDQRLDIEPEVEMSLDIEEICVNDDIPEEELPLSEEEPVDDEVDESPRGLFPEPELDLDFGDNTVEPSEDEQRPLTIAERLSGASNTLGDLLAATNHKADTTVADRLNMDKPANIKSAIGINDKFYFINKLFDGDVKFYNETIDKFSNLTSLNDAKILLQLLINKYSWNFNDTAYKKFEDIIERNFE